MNTSRLIALCLATLAATSAADARAGMLIAPSARWMNFSFRPDGNRDAVNYYAVGGGFTAGYSVAQVFDVAGVMQYAQGRATPVVRPYYHDCTLSFYGAEIAARLNQSVYLALRGGNATRTLESQKLDTEIPGSWSGTTIGLSVGGITPVSKKGHFAQISVSAMVGPEMLCDSSCPDNVGMQRLEGFSVDLAWVFNGRESSAIDQSMLGSYVKGLLSW